MCAIDSSTVTEVPLLEETLIKKKKKKNLVCVEAEESLSETSVPST